MTITTISGDDFDDDYDHVVQAVAGGPVIVTESGKEAFVFMIYADYLNLPGVQHETETPNDHLGR